MLRKCLSPSIANCLAAALAITACALPGCTKYNLSSPGVRDQAAEFGANPRPKPNPHLRFGVSPEARQIEESLGH
jgi:hypothetical protein